MLSPRLTLGHGVWLTEEDIELLAETGTCVCHNCSSNFRLRSGIAPLNALEAKGIGTAIGIDEAGLNDDRDMLQEMRLVLRAHRVPGLDAAEVPTVPQVVRRHHGDGGRGQDHCFPARDRPTRARPLLRRGPHGLGERPTLTRIRKSRCLMR